MAATDNFRKQHADIAEIVAEIQKMLEPQKLADASSKVRARLSSLLGKITVHLAMEDNSLYPRCQKHDDPALSQTAEKFAAEMSGLKGALDAFSKKWSDAAIGANAAAFCAEARQLFATLNDRIKRENTVFYPLVDKAL